MDAAEAQRLVSLLTYKPDWTLECYPDPGPRGGVILRYGKDEPDCEHGGIRALMYTAALSRVELNALDRNAFLQFAFDTIAKRELHEVEEWLRLEGVPLREPHPAMHHRGILGDGTSLDPPIPGHCVQDQPPSS